MNKKETTKFIVQIIISIASAILTEDHLILSLFLSGLLAYFT